MKPLSSVALALIACFGLCSVAQNAPLVIAFRAPQCNDTATNCYNQTAYPNFYNFVTYELPFISGIGIEVPWAQADNCSGDALPNPWCTSPPAACPESAGEYKFCKLDTILNAYIGQSQWINKRIVLIVNAVNDSSPNSNVYTPDYVFSSANWANTAGGSCAPSCPPQDVVVCGSWKGSVGTSGTCPVTGTVNSGSYAVWNTSGGSSGPDCQTYGTSGLTCSSSCGVGQSLGGFPIVYEQPFMVAYQNLLKALAQHYNATTGNSNGVQIAPYIAYVRVGMAEGGENQPICAAKGFTPQSSRGSTVQSGYVVGPGSGSGTLYVATGAGTVGSTMPTCSPAGCTTAPDGMVSGWYNAGSYGPVGLGNAIWPGPKGVNTLTGDPQGYQDDGYLALWTTPSKSAGQLGYITAMVTFLKGLNASFPFDISAHNGPPSSGTAPSNVAYADSEAIVASANGVGFGMESVSINDPQAFAAGNFPTSKTDWVHNFKTYPAPVHHLQMYQPGGGSYSNPQNSYFAAGYPFYQISVGGAKPYTATISCGTDSADQVDCSPFAGEPVYITGNANAAINGTWQASVAVASNQLQFPTNSLLGGYTGSGGTVWSPNYWPMVMPFVVQHNATTVEVYECDLDYAFGTFSLGTGQPPDNPTTAWITAPPPPTGSGCAAWGVQQPSASGYSNSASNTQIGQPSSTSVRTGNSSVTNGTQF
jgi:hypothetical protein